MENVIYIQVSVNVILDSWGMIAHQKNVLIIALGMVYAQKKGNVNAMKTLQAMIALIKDVHLIVQIMEYVWMGAVNVKLVTPGKFVI